MTNKFEPKESCIPGYYHVLCTDRVVVNRKGSVLELTPNGPKTATYDFRQCDTARVSFTTFYTHRLLCEAFKECPGDPKDFQVNHIDHDKLNNDLDNLEWVTASENIVAAFKAGVRSDNIVVETKDIHTNEVVKYYSVNECARQHNCSPENVRHHLKGLSASPFKGRYKIRMEGDKWPRMNAKTKDNTIVHRPTVIVGPDEQVAITKHRSTAAKFVGMDPRRLADMMKETAGGPVYRLDFELYDQDKYPGSLENAVEYHPKDTRVLPARNKKVAARKGKGPWLIYTKAAELTPVLGLGRSAIQKRIKAGGGRFEFKGWEIKYL